MGQSRRPGSNRVVQDPEIANLYVIGNGSLSMVWLAEDDRYDWVDVSRSSNHLKRGWVHQRQCGGLTRRLNVPLGLFMLEEPARLVAALDSAFAPPSLDHPTNERPASCSLRVSCGQVDTPTGRAALRTICPAMTSCWIWLVPS
jgi:hypothetical protein